MISHPTATTSVPIGVVFSSFNGIIASKPFWPEQRRCWPRCMHIVCILRMALRNPWFQSSPRVSAWRIYHRKRLPHLCWWLGTRTWRACDGAEREREREGEGERDRSKIVSELYGVYPEAVCSTESLLHHFFMCVLHVSSPESKLLIQGIS